MGGKRANQRWNQKNKARFNYLKQRSTVRSFIRKKATKNDLKEIQTLIKECQQKLSITSQ